MTSCQNSPEQSPAGRLVAAATRYILINLFSAKCRTISSPYSVWSLCFHNPSVHSLVVPEESSERENTPWTVRLAEKQVELSHLSSAGFRLSYFIPSDVIWSGQGYISVPLASRNVDRAEVSIYFVPQVSMFWLSSNNLNMHSAASSGRLPLVSSSFPHECHRAQFPCWHVLCLTRRQSAGMSMKVWGGGEVIRDT